jgi:cation diffusion facilitator family transporter
LNAKNHNSTENVTLIRRISVIGIFGNLLLSILKLALGVLGNSQAVIADAVHSLSDMTTDFAVLFGVKYWSAPADDDHPYGHHRIETMITMMIGIALVLISIGLFYNAIKTVRIGDLEQPAWVAIIGPLASLVVKELLYRYTFKTGQRTRSSAVIANAWHHRSDAISSIPALVAVFLAVIHPQLVFVDRVGALIISLIILKISWDIFKPALAELMDMGASARERNKIESIALSVDGVKSMHAVRTRKAGAGLYVDLHIQVDGSLSVHDGHRISTIVKERLLEKGPLVTDVVVHLEPFEELSEETDKIPE